VLPSDLRRSVRLPAFDYRTAGAYFVTLCTHGRAPALSRVTPHGVCLTDSGRIVAQEWHRTVLVRPYVHLDTFAVMPDHVHGVLWIANADLCRGAMHGALSTTPSYKGAMHGAPTLRRAGPPIPGSVSTIVAMFKAAVTRRVNAVIGTPGAPFWQRGFYEHVVRGDADLTRIRRYVAENPARWWAQRGAIIP